MFTVMTFDKDSDTYAPAFTLSNLAAAQGMARDSKRDSYVVDSHGMMVWF